MDIARLRHETAQEHQAVEGTLPLMDTDLDRSRYILCLQRMYGLVAAWDEGSAKAAPEWLQDSLSIRRRAGLLSHDLVSLGATAHAVRSPLPALDDLNALLGAMYVMEGSTLGGQLIARHVQTTLGLAPGVGNSYFIGHGDLTGSMWKSFCQVLMNQVPDKDTNAVIGGAKSMFQTFGSWMRAAPASRAS